jgi:hypothetical protein
VRPSAGDDVLATIAADARSPLDAVVDAEEEGAVWRALDALPDALREPLVLYYGGDQSVREVAAALEISEAAARQRLSRGRSRLEANMRDAVSRRLKRAAPGAAFTAAVAAALVSAPRTAVASSSVGVSAAWLGAAAVVAAAAVGAMLLIPAAPLAEAPASMSASTVAPALAATVAPAGNERAARARWFRPRKPSAPPPARAEHAAMQQDDDRISLALHQQLARKIDIDLNDAAVGNVIAFLGEAGGVDIVVTGDIASNVTFDLHATTVMEALDETLEQAGAVWREVSLVRVVASTERPGIPGAFRPITLEVADAAFDDVIQALSQSLDLPVVVDAALAAPPVTAQLVDMPAAQALDAVIAAAGLGYEVVPAIQVRPEEDSDEWH